MTVSADRAAVALAAYPHGDQRPVDVITDFLPDLMAWCRVNRVDFDRAVQTAQDDDIRDRLARVA